MPKLLRTIILFCFLLLASSCGKFSRLENGGYTTVHFQPAHSPDAAIMSGGIMIYLYSPDFSTNIFLPDETANPGLTIPNGPYSLYAFGYTQPFGSQAAPDNSVRCAVKTGIALSGTAVTIPVTLRQPDCSNGAFTGNGSFTDPNTSSTLALSGLLFPQVDLVHCSSAASAFLASSSANVGTNCASFVMPTVSKFQISLPIYLRNQGGFSKLSDGLISNCSNSNPSNAGLTAGSQFTRLPVGSTDLPFLFPVEIRSYSDASCTSTPLAVNTFYKGLVFGPTPTGSNASKIFAATSGSGKAKLFLTP
ncbi:MAG: hypothetical protein ACXWQO_00165 [Bdellovibrionota bacterium]